MAWGKPVPGKMPGLRQLLHDREVAEGRSGVAVSERGLQTQAAGAAARSGLNIPLDIARYVPCVYTARVLQRMRVYMRLTGFLAVFLCELLGSASGTEIRNQGEVRADERDLGCIR